MQRNLVLLLFSLLVALLGAEGALRLAGKLAPPPYPPEAWRPELYTGHPEYGYALWPSRTTQYEYPPAQPRRLTVNSNSDGFRSTRELDEDDPRTRVLILGDSYVFGEGVEESERFSEILERLEPEWRVDNLGMTGWGPDLMLMALEAVGQKASPDLVIFTLFFDDFRRVRQRYAGMGFPTPRFELRDGRLVRVPYPRPKPWERWHLYHGILQALSGPNRPYSAPTDAEWELNEKILDRFRELGRERGFSPVLLYLAGPWKGAAQDRRTSWVRRYGEEHDVPWLDLTEPIQAAGEDSVYLHENRHYGPVGHRIIAVELHDFLTRNMPRRARAGAAASRDRKLGPGLALSGSAGAPLQALPRLAKIPLASPPGE